jgi:hypothetical protein
MQAFQLDISTVFAENVFSKQLPPHQWQSKLHGRRLGWVGQCQPAHDYWSVGEVIGKAWDPENLKVDED